MGKPDNPEQFVRLKVDDLSIYVGREIWDRLKPKQSKLLIAVAGYGRYWLYLDPPSSVAGEGRPRAD